MVVLRLIKIFLFERRVAQNNRYQFNINEDISSMGFVRKVI